MFYFSKKLPPNVQKFLRIFILFRKDIHKELHISNAIKWKSIEKIAIDFEVYSYNIVCATE